MASLGGLPTPLVVMCAGGVLSALLLLQALHKWKLGFLVFLYLTVHNLPQLLYTQLFLVPYSFFVFRCWRRPLSSCKDCNKESQISGPSLSHHYLMVGHLTSLVERVREVFRQGGLV